MSTKTTEAPILQSTIKLPTLVIGLDFGTCGTGFGFRFTSSTSSDIKKNYDWPKKKQKYAKAKSAILYQNDQIVSIADVAFDDFTSSVSTSDLKYFDLIKLDLMRISNKKSLTDEEKDERDEIIERISDYLSKMKEIIIEHISAIDTISEKDMKWVVSIPSQCSEQYAENLKSALVLAEIIPPNASEQKCLIVKESEAAGVSCFVLGSYEIQNGKKYMIVDAGGGTVDITTHIVDKKRLKEISTTAGKSIGSSTLDRYFEKYISDAIGFNEWISLKETFVQEYNDLMSDWEKAKVEVEDSFSKKKLNIWPELQDLLIASSKDISIEKRRFRLILEAETMEAIFSPVIKAILDYIEESLKKMKKKTKLDYMFVVGGLSQNRILRKAIKDKFGSSTTIYFPNESGSAVIDGCVLLGIDPSIIKSRKSAFSYGIDTQRECVYGEDKEEYIYYSKEVGEFLCKNAFEKFVEINEDVEHDYVKEKSFDIDPNSTETRITIYKSINPNAKYVTDDGVGEVFTIVFDPASAKNIVIKMSFGKSVISTLVTTSEGVEIPIKEIVFHSK